jgi:hypothetical protein
VFNYYCYIGKPEGKKPLRRLKHRWVENIKIDLEERMGWSGLVQDRDKWKPLVNVVMNLRVP